MFNEKLRLRTGGMTNSWLIQRLEKPHSFKVGGKDVDNPFSFGGGLKNGGLSEDAMGLLRSILSFDYMGSAEFEFGAVPAAFRFLAEQASKGNIVTGKQLLGKGVVFHLCPKEYELEVKSRIHQLYQDEYKIRLKESCGLRRSIEGTKEWDRRVVGWIELDNGFMFFTDPEMFNGICKLFGLNGSQKD